MSTIKTRSKIMDAIHKYIACKHVRLAVMDHLERSLAETVAMGRLLAQLATLKPLETSFPNVDKDLPPLDDVTL